MDSSILEEILGSNGKLASRLRKYEYRPEQIQMAKAIWEAFEEKKHIIIEAGTGLGKTIAYLLPSILYSTQTGKKILISSYTINLQEQIINKDIPLLNAITPVEFNTLLVKGRNNYLCLRRLARVSGRVDLLFSEPTGYVAISRLREWSAKTNSGALNDIDFPVPSWLWNMVQGEQGNCLGRRCVFFDRCHYWKIRRRIQYANIIIANHALLCSDLQARKEGTSILGNYEVAIIDEAHNFENVASEHFGLHLSQNAFFYTLNSLYNPRNGKGLLTCVSADTSSFIDTTERVGRIGSQFFKLIRENFKDNEDILGKLPTQAMSQLVESIEELTNKLTFLRSNLPDEEDRFEITSIRDKLLEFASALKELISANTTPPSNYTYWVEFSGTDDSPNRTVTLKSGPISVAEDLSELLFSRVESVVLTSATLSVGGSIGLNYIARRVGAKDFSELILDSPFDYKNQVTLYIETSLPDPSEEDKFIPAAYEAIKKYLKISNGRAFILFTSYKSLTEVAKRLKHFCKKHNWPMLIQEQNQISSANRTKMLDEFRISGNAVLLGTDSFWQGVDVVGEALSNVIIVKLPFAVPDKPLTKARIEQINQSGGNAFTEYQLPEAILKFKQGFGRLIRSKSDRGIVVVLDKRIITRSYGKWFLQALPEVNLIIK